MKKGLHLVWCNPLSYLKVSVRRSEIYKLSLSLYRLRLSLYVFRLSSYKLRLSLKFLVRFLPVFVGGQRCSL